MRRGRSAATAYVAFALALAMAGAASAQSASSLPIGRSIFDTPRFTVALPPGFAEIRRNDKDQPLFYFSDVAVNPPTHRAFTIMFFEGGDFANGEDGSMLQTMALGLAQQHTNFRTSKPYYLDSAKKMLCSRWMGDMGGVSFTGVTCEVRTRAGFALLHAMDATSSFPEQEAAYKSTLLSFQLKR
jgi:hypothetical protein